MKGWVGRLIRSDEQSDADVREELRFHLDERTAELMATGLDEVEARRRASSEFGDMERVEDETRRVARQKVGRWRWRDRWEAVRQDAWFAGRLWSRSPGFALAAVLTLGLGMGAATAVFTVVDAVLIRSLPYPDADRLVTVWETHPGQDRQREPTSASNFNDLRAGASSFRALAAWHYISATARTDEGAEVLNAAAVTTDFFDVLGVAPALGRRLVPGDERSAVVISHGYWQTRFGGARDVVGRTLELVSGATEIVGVMPAGYAAPSEDVDLWVHLPVEARTDHRAARHLLMLGRLRPGRTLEAAEAELATVAARLGQEYPATNQGWSVRLVSAHEEVVGGAGDLLLVLLGAVGLLLLLATMNVSNMLLGHAAVRDREMAVRSALGASRRRIRWQLLVESGLLALAAGALGVVLAHFGVRFLLSLEPDAIPRASEVAVNYRILGFAAIVSLGASVIMGLAPGRRAVRLAPGRALGGRSGASRGSAGLRRALVVAELGLSVMLLIGSGLLFRSLVEIRSLAPGYATAGVLAAKMKLDPARYPSAEARAMYFDALLEEVRSRPGIRSAGVTSTMPLDPAGTDFALAYSRPGDPPVPEAELPEAGYRIISPGYLAAMGMRLTAGRDLAATDQAGGRAVVLVNRTFAERLWPGEAAVGRRVVVHYIRDGGIEWEIVGVVDDTRHSGLAQPSGPQFFVPMTQAEWLFDYMTLVARHEGRGGAIADILREAALTVDPNQPLFDLQTIEALRATHTARERLAATLMGTFSLLALILSVVGVYGVVSYQVTRRTRELGVRMALGASQVGVVRMVVGEIAGLTTLALLMGLAAAAAASRSLAGLLHGVSALDPAVYLGGAALLFVSALLSATVPAWRAARLDPVGALRTD